MSTKSTKCPELSALTLNFQCDVCQSSNSHLSIYVGLATAKFTGISAHTSSLGYNFEDISGRYLPLRLQSCVPILLLFACGGRGEKKVLFPRPHKSEHKRVAVWLRETTPPAPCSNSRLLDMTSKIASYCSRLTELEINVTIRTIESMCTELVHTFYTIPYTITGLLS